MIWRNNSNRRGAATARERGEVVLPIGALFMVLILGLALIGVGYGLWFKILTIEGTVQTGEVHASFEDAFTDDDGVVNHPDKDSNDVGDCPIGGRGDSSCDPAESGRDPKPRYEKDVGWCAASIDPGDNNFGFVDVLNAYPSYFCTAWFDIVNDGSIPVRVASVLINGTPVRPSVTTPFNLAGDDGDDLELHISEIRQCQQIEPGDLVQMDIDQHVLQPAPQGATLSYEVKIQLNQFNESGCRVLLYYGNSGIAPGNVFGYPGSDGELFGLKALYESMGFVVDYTGAWPASLDPYHLVVLYGPGNTNDTDFFSAAQIGDMTQYMETGGRIALVSDWDGFAGTDVPNRLLANLGIGIRKRTPATFATPDGDTCAPLTDMTPDQVTAGLANLDPAATTPLDLLDGATSLARVDAAPYTCLGGVLNGATWMAVGQVAGAPARPGADLVVIGDANILDDTYGFGDPNGDGMSGAALGANLVGH